MKAPILAGFVTGVVAITGWRYHQWVEMPSFTPGACSAWSEPIVDDVYQIRAAVCQADSCKAKTFPLIGPLSEYCRRDDYPTDAPIDWTPGYRLNRGSAQ